ncbi:uncharacterized protein LOC100908841 [Galendromus occidentalis]|uniref:Elongation of very long chain fatty acids protein n=1 Tax=Galendromus occidentalis TaxID=34638 RepID=A0AAJ6QUQ0_9ACAR|nr:uncharacterized protein LOC100908841 [Galendromus occidentalis]
MSVPRDWIDNLLGLDRDPRTLQWWITGIIPIPAVLVAYTAAATVLPLLMSGRKSRLPISTPVLAAYNGLMCAAHGLVGLLLLYAYQESGRSFVCQDQSFDANPTSALLLKLVWFYSLLKQLSMLDAFILISLIKEKRIANASVLNGYLSVANTWCFLRYGADGQGVPAIVALCLVDSVTYGYFVCSVLGSGVMSVLRPHRVQLTRLQLIGTSLALANYFVALIAECKYPSVLALLGFAHVGMRFVRLFDFYTEKFVLNGVRLGLDWTIIAGILENCCFAQGNPSGQQDDDDDYPTKAAPSTGFRNGFSGPITKPKRG